MEVILMVKNKTELVIEWREYDVLEEVRENIKADEDYMEYVNKFTCDCKKDKVFENEVDCRMQERWNDDMNYLTEIMDEINRDIHWYCKTVNNGWAKRRGYQYFKALTGNKLLHELLPADSSFTIKRHGRMLIINASHHDSPCGGEMYYIVPGKARYW
jgi:hypothetical protein